MAAPKKTFKDNPALAFISTGGAGDTPNTQDTQTTQAPAKKEAKTRRMNLTFQPSTVEAIDKIAFLRRTSVNDLINTVLKEYAAAHTDEIQKYDAIFPKED